MQEIEHKFTDGEWDFALDARRAGKEGDIVRHKLSWERLMITRITGKIVRGVFIDKPCEVPSWQNGFKEKEPQRGICLIENIEVI